MHDGWDDRRATSRALAVGTMASDSSSASPRKKAKKSRKSLTTNGQASAASKSPARPAAAVAAAPAASAMASSEGPSAVTLSRAARLHRCAPVFIDPDGEPPTRAPPPGASPVWPSAGDPRLPYRDIHRRQYRGATAIARHDPSPAALPPHPCSVARPPHLAALSWTNRAGVPDSLLLCGYGHMVRAVAVRTGEWLWQLGAGAGTFCDVRCGVAR